MATNLDKGQMALLKQMVRGDAWDVLLLALKDYLDGLKDQQITGANAFETLRELHTRQGKEDGLKEFFDKVEKMNLE